MDEKSNEITAFPKLIERLELKGTIVTTDALNTQKKAAAAVINQKADYVLPVKENHKDLYEDIKLLFEDADKKTLRVLMPRKIIFEKNLLDEWKSVVTSF